MFQDSNLRNHLNTSSTVKSSGLIVAEWNLNVPENIAQIGNYRFRPADASDPYHLLHTGYDHLDSNDNYTNATNADVVVDAGVDNDGTPTFITQPKQKEQLLYSLEDCFGKMRPRSGINKARWFGSGYYLHHSNPDMASRPRYYVSSKNDKFKYWSSYRTEGGKERGIANQVVDGSYYIDDAAPFVVYKNQIPANRIVVKMQSNVGTVSLGGSDPLFGEANKTVPVRWKIQYLENNSWADAISFDETSQRANQEAVIGPDGYVEVAYGLKIPEPYQEFFVQAGTYVSSSELPVESVNGYAYLVGATNSNLGQYYVWLDSLNGYANPFTPTYGWFLIDDVVGDRVPFVNELVNPPTYAPGLHREFQNISGLRLVVETMNKQGSVFDLIELSPRLAVDMTERTVDYEISKIASDIGVSGLPVGQLLAGTGTINIFDYDNAFLSTNTNSIISQYFSQYLQVKFYEVINQVDTSSGVFNYYVPIKTMYVEGFPESTPRDRTVSMIMRDSYFYFESMPAPEILITNVSLSFAIATLLDSIGFSNYSFKRLPDEADPTIPVFFIPPDTTVAQVLDTLASSTQYAMFFDEYNNFVVMSKNYIMPSTTERSTDLELYGSKDTNKAYIVENNIDGNISNIVDIMSKDNLVYNNGVVAYSQRHIRRSYSNSNFRDFEFLNKDKPWVYQPSELWELAPESQIRSINNQNADQSAYILVAMPLNSDLTDSIPVVSNNRIINNEIDLGEAANFIARYNGYLFANGEVIKYDAVQYSIPGLQIGDDLENSGNVWISSESEYQNYISKLPFGGKIYATGFVRIYVEPNFEEINGIIRLKNGPVAKHGRGQFGTPVTLHRAGIDPHWYDDINLRGCNMEAQYLFSDRSFSGNTFTNRPAGQQGVAPDRSADTVARRSNRNSIIKNFIGKTSLNETEINRLYSTQSGTVQASALVFSGPSYLSDENALNHISYVHKPLDNRFVHFGTRLRIVGKYEADALRSQIPVGVANYYTVTNTTSDQNINIGGASAGIAVMVNPETNVGYYFELASLTESNVTNYEGNQVHDIFFYKVVADVSNVAIPQKLWSDFLGVNVDGGDFVGQSRIVAEINTTVYDLSVEYEDIGSTRRFYLYVNNNLVQVVDDINPLPVYKNMALFVRGGTRAMFENVYALTNNYSQNTTSELNLPAKSVFGATKINISDAFRKYAMSGIVQSTYLSGIGSAESPKHQIYFEEFGTIMREAAYFDVRYDKAYPALSAKIADTGNPLKGYTISGFLPGSYGAEFMVFNNTDTYLLLDSQSGNYLRISGVAFTQEAINEYRMDDYFNKKGSFSSSEFIESQPAVSTAAIQKQFKDIKLSRLQYGNKEFAIASPYIQTQDDADNLMSWLVQKITKPRLSVGVEIFSDPTIQLGDVVTIDYKENGVNQIAPDGTRFVVYQMTHSRSNDGPTTTIYLSEVTE